MTQLETELSDLISFIDKRFPAVGEHSAILPFITVHRFLKNDVMLKDLQKPGAFIVLEGKVTVDTGEASAEVKRGEFFIPALFQPMTAVASFSAENRCFLAVSAAFEAEEILGVLLELENLTEIVPKGTEEMPLAASAGSIIQVLTRLFASMENEAEISFMAKHLKNELIFKMISSPLGLLFIKNTFNIRKSIEIFHINSLIRKNFKEELSVNNLASQANMSVSGFHQKFKDTVGMGPIQCQKKLRLNEARRLMLYKSMSVTEAAFEVGYKSLSQFIKDYSGVFGKAPQKDIQDIRRNLVSKLSAY